MITQSVINHLWQSSWFVLLAGLLAYALRKNPAKIRFWVWLSASLKFLMPFVLLVRLGTAIPGADRHPVSVASPAVSNTIVQITEPFSTAFSTTVSASTRVDWALVAIGVVWALGFFAIAVARWRSWLSVRKALRRSTPIELPIPVPAFISPGVEEPGIVGFVRPVLVLPAQVLEHLTPRQFEAILVHEMCHVRRRDNFFATIHMVVEAIFWFHPLVWWIGARLLEEREVACDEEVLGRGCEPADYVQGILRICRFYAESPLSCVSGVTGSDIKKRLRAILEGSIAPELGGVKKATLAAIGVAALAVPILAGMLKAPAIHAQSATAIQPKFELASIKPNGRRGGGTMRPWPGRLTASAPLGVLMEAAYHVQPFQIVGGPEWVKIDGYTVDAKASGNPDHGQMRLMLQSLLADRFQLRFHRESRQMSSYALMPAAGGLKLATPRDGSCGEEQAPPPGPGDPAPRPRCGGMDVPFESGSWHMRGGRVPMAEFVRVLSLMLGRTVTDQTRFSGVFDVDLHFRADDSIVGFPPPPGAASADTESTSIFDAVQQMGLRLVAARSAVEVLVIDHVERPSAE